MPTEIQGSVVRQQSAFLIKRASEIIKQSTELTLLADSVRRDSERIRRESFTLIALLKTHQTSTN
jgi:hypothetical protein